jgi:hypothetical protein
MPDEDAVIGDEPLVDGMSLSIRLRRDFTVTDAARLLAAARRTYVRLHPGSTEEQAAEHVTCAADALFVLLEHAGLLGDELDRQLAAHTTDGLAAGGWRAQVITDEPRPLAPEPRQNCLLGDPFALPTSDDRLC